MIETKMSNILKSVNLVDHKHTSKTVLSKHIFKMHVNVNADRINEYIKTSTAAQWMRSWRSTHCIYARLLGVDGKTIREKVQYFCCCRNVYRLFLYSCESQIY
uniref:Uncharacterized protein n=1 Tax=Aplanochytrium stocchinoi TaxID=215587 RepID=A0A7S3V025_9STRA